jgi:hypothetical protein
VTADKSRTFWSIVNTKLVLFVGGVFGGLKALWEFLCNILDVLPTIVTDVGGTLDQGKQVSQFLSLSTEQWMAIAAVIAVPLLIIAAKRHLAEKQKAAPQSEPQEATA